MPTSTTTKLKPAASTKTLLEFCNKVREAGGAKPLDALLPGIPKDAYSCLIAKNLNFKCEVDGYEPSLGRTEEDAGKLAKAINTEDDFGSYAWCMSVYSRKTRNQIAEALNLEPVDIEKDPRNDKYRFAVILPSKIANAASNFDAIGEQYAEDFRGRFLFFIEEEELPAKEAAEKAHKEASAGFTEAMKRYAKLTEVNDAP